MASTATAQITFAELERLPEPEGFHYELHHGELIQVPPPKLKHYAIQYRLRRALEAAAGDLGMVEIEMGFRPTPEYEYRVADVAFLSAARRLETPEDGYIQGAPEIVMEVLSPSNTASEIMDKERICLHNGTQEFWVVDPVRPTVKVSTPHGQNFYSNSDEIPLLFGGSLPVGRIFGE